MFKKCLGFCVYRSVACSQVAGGFLVDLINVVMPNPGVLRASILCFCCGSKVKYAWP